MHIPDLFLHSLTRQERKKIIESKYALNREGNLKQPVDLTRLSEPVANFGQHLRNVFRGTRYGISRAVDCTSRPVRDEEKNWVHSFFEIYQLRHEGSGMPKALPAGEVRVRGIESKYSPIVEVYSNMANLEKEIRDFNFLGFGEICYLP